MATNERHTTWKQEIVKRYGHEYVFRQLAEESAELCQASLKLVRVMNQETPVHWGEAQDHLLEEVADVLIMIDILGDSMLTRDAIEKIERLQADKERRMRERMLEGD